ncbi:MAG: hypothetical protein JW767_11190 [Thermoleophilia bacterium]|nr:hypothetical protein [Thermoleophilia bacterium]
MGQVSPLPPPRNGAAPDIAPACARPVSPVRMITTTRCALCGTRLEEGAERFFVVSPQSVDRVLTVCHTCRNAALSEGYRPAG